MKPKCVCAQLGELGLREGGELVAVDGDRPVRGAQQAAEHRQQRGLAAAGRSHDEHDLARADCEVQVVHGVDGRGAVAEAAGEALGVEDDVGGGHGFS